MCKCNCTGSHQSKSSGYEPFAHDVYNIIIFHSHLHQYFVYFFEYGLNFHVYHFDNSTVISLQVRFVNFLGLYSMNYVWVKIDLWLNYVWIVIKSLE